MLNLRHLIAIAVAAGVVLPAVSACNTVEGAGKDVKSTGKAIEREAREEKNEHR